MPVRVADMLSVDLERAGIPKTTPSGTVDLHGLRVTYISNLVSSGASVKTCQVLARHSTPHLTIGIYAKATMHDLAGAVNALPDLGPDAPPVESARATGPEGQLINDHLAHHLPTAGDGSGRTVADAVAMARDTVARPKSCSSKDLSVADGLSRDGSVRVADGIRTRDPQIHNLFGLTAEPAWKSLANAELTSDRPRVQATANPLIRLHSLALDHSTRPFRSSTRNISSISA
jgi:hypothetical protein